MKLGTPAAELGTLVGVVKLGTPALVATFAWTLTDEAAAACAVASTLARPRAFFENRADTPVTFVKPLATFADEQE